MNLKILPKDIAHMFKMDNCKTIGNYVISNTESGHINHFYIKKHNDYSFILLGSMFGLSKEKNPIDFVIENYFSNNSVYDLDGSFIFVVFLPNHSIEIFSERNGLIPLYYRVINDNIAISTESSDLFYDYSIDDIDFSSVYDLLRYGMLVGDNTMSKKVKLLQSGTLLTFINKAVELKRLFKFVHDSSNQINDEELLLTEIDKAYENALLKRCDRPENQIAVFLSGGMDSRLIIAYANKCFKNKIKAYSFGQNNSEEVDVARKVSEIGGNEFQAIKLMPKNFIENSLEYLKRVSGSDFFPQSYIINASKQIAKENITSFMTGSFIECYMGGTFLLNDALEYEGLFSEYVITHVDSMKCGLFKEEEINNLVSNKQFFDGKRNNLYNEALKWNDYLVKDAIQAFITDIRDKRLVLNREIVPSIYLDYINPNFDKDLLNVLSKIPPEKRIARNIYRKLFISKFPDYSNIVYNNTTLPISSDLELWKKNASIEFEREKLFALEQRKGKNIYYPHFYSDFEGYSKYDCDWIDLIKRSLLNEKSIISNFFNMSYIKNLVMNHFSSENSYRKKIVCLISLELFFEYYFKKEN